MKVKIISSALVLSTVLCCCSLEKETYDYHVIETSPIVTETNIVETTIPFSKEEIESIQTTIKEPEIKTITISAVGDCTLGTDLKYGIYNSFVEKASKVDDEYFFSGVKDVLLKDDYTIANLECALTDDTIPKDKQFAFKGDIEFVNILKEGSVECVNTANNHSYDYYEAGYKDTLESLENASIDHFGYDVVSIKEIDGIKIANAGFTSYYAGNVTYKEIKDALDKMEEMNADIKIITIHGGIEKEYEFDSIKQDFAHYAIDNGADLVIGHHPHVLQGIEEYKGKNIVYSLGNFCYGGHRNPPDKDSMIYQQMFTFVDGKLDETKVNIIPVSLSSSKNINDYKPSLVDEEESERIINKILKYSKNFEYQKEEQQ